MILQKQRKKGIVTNLHLEKKSYSETNTHKHTHIYICMIDFFSVYDGLLTQIICKVVKSCVGTHFSEKLITK